MKKIPKINSNAYGWKWILLSVLIGGVLPLLIRLITGKFLWQLCVAGRRGDMLKRSTEFRH